MLFFTEASPPRTFVLATLTSAVASKVANAGPPLRKNGCFPSGCASWGDAASAGNAVTRTAAAIRSGAREPQKPSLLKAGAASRACCKSALDCFADPDFDISLERVRHSALAVNGSLVIVSPHGVVIAAQSAMLLPDTIKDRTSALPD